LALRVVWLQFEQAPEEFFRFEEIAFRSHAMPSASNTTALSVSTRRAFEGRLRFVEHSHAHRFEPQLVKKVWRLSNQP
jgi:hypothetical protein